MLIFGSLGCFTKILGLANINNAWFRLLLLFASSLTFQAKEDLHLFDKNRWLWDRKYLEQHDLYKGRGTASLCNLAACTNRSPTYITALIPGSVKSVLRAFLLVVAVYACAYFDYIGTDSIRSQVLQEALPSRVLRT